MKTIITFVLFSITLISCTKNDDRTSYVKDHLEKEKGEQLIKEMQNSSISKDLYRIYNI